MSDSLNHDALSDDLFRNRIAAALSELDQPESDADIAAALDAMEAEPLSDEVQRRVMRQVQRSIAATSASHRSLTLRVEQLGLESQATGRWRSQVVVLACSALVAVGLVFQRFGDIERSPLRPGELMSSNDRRPGHRPIQASQASAVIQRVKLGETVSTGPREKRRVTLPDGSVLSINEQSQVTVVGQRRVKLLAGEVFVEVVPTANSGRFVVETPQRTVTALGTKFVVKAQGRATSVVVTQGKVQVSGFDEVIPAGQELIADLNESTSAELRPAKRSAYVVEWVKDLMASAGSIVVPASEHAGGTVTVVDPQGQEMKLSLRKFHVDVHIEEGFARTTIDQTYFNHTWQQLEGTFRFPLPADASLSRLAMYVNGKLMEGGMVERDYGRNVFEQIRHTKRDPALLEWVDGSTFQMRVFPLEARQEKRILLSYTQRLPNDYGKAVYRFPSGHSLEGVREWSAFLRVKGAAGTKWYSPSHLLNGRDEHGDLLIDGREEYAALDRDLVVELVADAASIRTDASSVGYGAAWTLCEQDGFQYLMLRQRPELKANAERSQRQWIFLVENSADRNDILAETQRQIAKVLLENAEHSDTFSIIRAGTQAESFHRKPVECSLENVEAAQQFLSGVAPIGALNLQQALQAVQKQVRGKRDVWIVHLGTGIPVLGERDETTLLRLLPANARYVGVAVGKRWSKSFMESAANHSGGHVTQINPDEAVAWRAFDLLSTLNAPRLTEIAVRSLDVAVGSEFLLLTNSLAHGQELAAVARFPKGRELPKSVTITGKLNGKAYSMSLTLPIDSLASGAASAPRSSATTATEITAIKTTGGLTPPRSPSCLHLPRTWARLEIDRLVGLGATEHKPQIIELSKAMYVMSPFTSLLVLETEAMYEQFKVDRGRKDHWAMYPAPAEIPVVADQSPSQLSPLDAAMERLKLSQARAKSAQSNYERSVAEKRPATDLQRLERLKRAEQAEVRLIESEIQRIEKANVAAADPIRIAWESVVQRRSAWQQGYLQQAARHHWNLWGRNNLWMESDWSLQGEPPLDSFGFQSLGEDDNRHGSLDGMWVDLDLPVAPRLSIGQSYVPLTSIRVLDLSSMLNLNASGNVSGNYFNTNAPDNGIALRHPLAFNGMIPRSNMGLSPIPVTPYFSTSLDGELREEFRYIRLPRVNSVSDDLLGARIDRPVIVLSDSWDVGFEELSQRGRGFQLPQVLTVPIGAGFGTDARQGVSWRSRQLFRDGPTMLGAIADFDGDMNGDGIADSIGFDMEPRLVFENGRVDKVRLQVVNGRGDLGTSLIDDSGLFASYISGSSPAFDSWPVIDGRHRHRYVTVDMSHPLAGVLRDLPSYAPGLQTWPADRLAIVEQATATKPKRGDIDAESRRLIEKARSLGWEKVRLISRNALASDSDRQKPDASAFRLMDGSGRFVFDREVGEGLREQVIHDGSTLWHLYPEIGLGAKRMLSRFHQSAIQSLIPWYVPSADDLSVEADVKSVGERTIRITRLKDDAPVAELARVRTDGDQTQILANSATDAPHQIAIELVFAEDGRLSETRVIDLTANKRLAKQTFAADGTIRLFDAEDKLIGEVKYERQPIEAPNLVPATKDLVVLPLPYRSAAGVPVTVPVNLQTNAPDYAKLSEEDALLLLGSYFAEARPAELATFIEQRYTAKGDDRIGLAVLLSSVVPQNPLVANATKQHPDLPIAKFLEQFVAFAMYGNRPGTLDAGPSGSPFLKRVCSTYNNYSRWAWNQVATREQSATDLEHDLAATLSFVRDCRSVGLAAKLLSTVHAEIKRGNRMNATLARQLIDATTAMSEERSIPAFARTLRIEWLLAVGDDAAVAQAKELFRTQLAEAIADGSLPALNGDTRSAFVKQFKTPDGQPCGPWGELVHEAARLDQPERASVRFGNNTNDQPDASAFRLIGLARACVSLSEPTLAAAIFQLAIKDQDLVAQPRLNLAALTFAKEASHWDQAEACVQRALADEKLQKVSQLWRDAAAIKHQLRKFHEWIECLDRAYELEFAALPKTVNLEAFRKDYDSLFGQLDQRAEQLADAQPSDKLSFARIVQRAAARWRDIDVDDTAACHRTAAILTKLGFATAAWNYWTTPLAETPDRSAVWTTFASVMQSQFRHIDADRAWSTAFACEPTNPEILLQHAQFLRSTRQEHKARELLTRITTSAWQPRFETTKQQAQTLLNGGNSSK